jgi:CRP-like cAMP-binding protein
MNDIVHKMSVGCQAARGDLDQRLCDDRGDGTTDNRTDTRLDPRDHGQMVVAARSVDAGEIDVSGHDPPMGVGAEIVQGNLLLAALPVEEQRRLAAELTVVDLGMRDQIYDVDATITEVYFPLTCVLSVVAAADEDVAVEIATIGLEGMAGLPVFLGAAASPHRCFCQIPGHALRLEADALRRLQASDGAGEGAGENALHHLLHRYTHVMMTFVGQNVACNRLHSAEERTARWLAHTHDRVNADTFPITQEFLALMLGVRRATVSTSARILHRAGLIRYSRGRMSILDRDGLHAAACDCYSIIRGAFEQLS